jgi:hypothetical protein
MRMSTSCPLICGLTRMTVWLRLNAAERMRLLSDDVRCRRLVLRPLVFGVDTAQPTLVRSRKPLAGLTRLKKNNTTL